MKSICVYCGSSSGENPIYVKDAQELGKALANNKLTLVYGGGSVGLMGQVADSVMDARGEAIGVITSFFMGKEVGHTGLTEMIVLDTMHQRKEKMYQLSDAFIAMPGGFGTLDELCEILTWQQIGHHSRPVALYNINGYFDLLVKQFQHFVDEGFLKKEQLTNLIVESDPKVLIEKLKNHQTIVVEKWID